MIDGRGKVVSEAKVATDPLELVMHLSRFGGKLSLVGLEAGALTPWLAREMVALGLPVW